MSKATVLAPTLASLDYHSRRNTNGKLQKYKYLQNMLESILTFFRKKMNFTTDLPKKDPLVSYIVASAVKCEKFFPGSSKEGPVFRMHAVILTKRADSSNSSNEFNFKKSGLSVLNSGNGVSRQNGKHSGLNKWAPA